jgi:apolipoprotein N-acyltransferase
MEASKVPDKKIMFSHFLKNQRWAILSGILMGTSYIPFPPWALLFCFTPLYWDLLRKPHTLREVFIKAWVTQFTFTLIGFYWIAYVSHEFGYLPWPVALLILLLFAAGMHMHIPLAAVFAGWLNQKFGTSKKWSYCVYALCFALADQLWPGMFPFHVGYASIWSGAPIYQWADAVGFLGLGLFVHLNQAVFGWVLESSSMKKGAFIFAALASVHLLLNWTGAKRAQQWSNPPEKIRVLQVQANVGNMEKLAAEKGRGYQKEIADRYFKLTRDALEKARSNQEAPVDLAIWPESAYPDFLDTHNSWRFHTQRFISFQKEMGVSILTGAFSSTEPSQRPARQFNALFLYDGEKGLENPPYRKTHLLAFGEFVPLGETFPILKKWNPGGEGFSRGDGPMVLNWRNLKLGVQICYESLYPEFSSSLIDKDADVLINLTNDSWFGPTSEPYQHLYMTLARAIETRRPLVRSTNTGITTAIEADGRLHEQSPLFSMWTNIFEVGVFPDADKTLYSQFGHLLPLLTLGLLGLVLAVDRRRERN